MSSVIIYLLSMLKTVIVVSWLLAVHRQFLMPWVESADQSEDVFLTESLHSAI